MVARLKLKGIDGRAHQKPATRCVIASDAGYTKADKGNKDTYICLYFARGHCSNGPECQYYHRVPLAEDEMRLDNLHDVFGREKHRTYRDDMGGVGSFNRNNHTLYITGLKRQSSSEELIVRHFSEWGKIEYARIIWDKMIAFVRYSWRSSAEFAKEAMIDQSLNDDEVLVIKWAHEDPNPAAQNKEEMRNLLQAAEAVNAKIAQEEPVYQYGEADNVSYQHFPSQADPTLYPTTDNQYQSNAYTNNSQAIQDWLEKVGKETKLKGLENYRDKIVSSDYADMNSLSQLDDIMLDAIGINKVEHRSALLEASKDLKRDLENQATQQQAYYDPQYYQQWQEYYKNYYNSIGQEYPGYDQSAGYAYPQQQQQQVQTYDGKPLVDYGPASDDE
eukprot:TRINITY_DN4203_c0_g1_i4.p1 TRINITY_DN4203_c0_g1~~TRINITY_DN4203_c0_g1_i4.p1  ORF type:complete len:389 (-),score=120.00 TRINITY_DN4203_c0_g1_i4:10-1176(-)